MCIRDSLIPLHYCSKSRYMDALEEFEIYRAHNNPVYVTTYSMINLTSGPTHCMIPRCDRLKIILDNSAHRHSLDLLHAVHRVGY